MTDIGEQVKQVLEEKGIDIGYNPNEEILKTWYKLPVKVFYCEDKEKVPYANFFKKKIKIYTKKIGKNRKKTPEETANMLLHEKTHFDVSPLGWPPFIYGIIKLNNHIDNPVNSLLAIIGYCVAYKLIDEAIIVGIQYIKYGSNYFTDKIKKK